MSGVLTPARQPDSRTCGARAAVPHSARSPLPVDQIYVNLRPCNKYTSLDVAIVYFSTCIVVSYICERVCACPWNEHTLTVVLSYICPNRVFSYRICVSLFAPTHGVSVHQTLVRRVFDPRRVDAPFPASTVSRCFVPPYRVTHMVAPAGCRS